MSRRIIIGRNETDLKKFGEEGTLFLGKQYVTMGKIKSLSTPIYLDAARPHVILIDGKRGCLPGDHKIFTNHGYKEIKDFDNENDKILSFNKNELEFEWKNAELLTYDVNPSENLVKLTLEDGRNIVITQEHPILVFYKDSVLVWRKGSKLKEGDLLLTTTALPEVKNDKESLRIARLLGYTLADGNIYIQKGRWKDGRGYWYNGTKKRLRIDTDSEEVCLQAKEDIEEEFGVTARFTWRKDCNCGRVKSTNSKVVDKLIKLGVPTGKKSDIIRVPQIVWESSNKFKANFINALFSCDGFIQKNGMKIEYYTNSKELAHDLQLLLAHFSIESKVKRKRRSDQPNYISYRVAFSDYTSIINFRHKIGFLNKNKEKRLQFKKFHLVKRRKGVKYIGEDLVCAKIKKKENINKISKVYDLEVPETHSFIANGVISHNSGKSYTLGVIAEGLANLPEEISQNVSSLIFDTMGIYWTMKYPNYKDDKLINEWGLKPKELNPTIYCPIDLFNEYQDKGIPVDEPFSIKPSDLGAEQFCKIFEIDLISEEGLLLQKVLDKAEEDFEEDFSIKDLINIIEKNNSDDRIKRILINRFESLGRWGIFSKEATNIDDMLKGGETAVLDLSAYSELENGEVIKALVIGILSRKILLKRLVARKSEEVELISEGTYLTGETTARTEQKAPLVWIMIDEAHEFLPKVGETLATYGLIQLLREGRQPGISLVLATQQPGKIHTDVLTQSDIVLSHRLTAKIDLEALDEIMQNYLAFNITKYIDNLPRVKGAGIILDDNSEKVYPMRTRPRFSWHGGEDPTALRAKVRRFELPI